MIYILSASFAIGILIEIGFKFSIYTIIFLFVCFFGALLVSIKHFYKGFDYKRYTIFFIVLGSLILGMFRAYLYIPNQFEKTDSLINEEIEFVGVVSEEPDERDNTTRYVIKANDNSYYDFKDNKILLVANRFPRYRYGDQILINGKIEIPKNFITESEREFQYKNYLLKDNIRYVSYNPEMELVSEGKGNFLISKLLSLKSFFVKNINSALPEPHSSLANGITVGLKNSLGNKILESFRKSGIIHIVVLSGYNLTIILALILQIFGKIPNIKRSTLFSLALVVMFLFSLMVGFGATVLRAFFMSCISLLGRSLGRKVFALRALCVTALIMIIINPYIILYDPSFQLSFLATFGLITFSPIIQSKVNQINLIKYVPSIISEILVTTVSTQIFLLPALIYMTGQFSLVSFFVNMIVLPFIPGAMFFTAVAGLVGSVSLTFSKIIIFPSFLILDFIFKISDFASNLKYSVLNIKQVPLIMVLVCYLTIIYFLWRRKVFEE